MKLLYLENALVKAHRLESRESRNPRVILDSKLGEEIEQILPKTSEVPRNTWKANIMRDVDGYYFVNYLELCLISHDMIHSKDK